MRFEFTPDQLAFKKEVHDFLEAELTPEVYKEHWDLGQQGWFSVEYTKAFVKKLGQTGFISIAWPEKYGGAGKDLVHELILAEELEYHMAPCCFTNPGLPGLSIVPGGLLAFGSEEQKGLFLPRLKRGEIFFLIGYSEPEAGSDLANLQTRAVETDDGFVLNGQKVFSTSGDFADYGWVAARTNPDVPKHKGISLFIVDMKSPGVCRTTHKTMSGWVLTEIFFDNVLVPKNMLVGRKDEGWRNLMAALATERTFTGNPGQLERNFDRLVGFCYQRTGNRPPLIRKPWVRAKLAELAIEVEAARLLAYRLAGSVAAGQFSPSEAALVHLVKRETVRKIDFAAVEILGPLAQLKTGSKWAPMQGLVEREYKDNLTYSFVAGGFDVNRNIIALQGLNLPRQA